MADILNNLSAADRAALLAELTKPDKELAKQNMLAEIEGVRMNYGESESESESELNRRAASVAQLTNALQNLKVTKPKPWATEVAGKAWADVFLEPLQDPAKNTPAEYSSAYMAFNAMMGPYVSISMSVTGVTYRPAVLSFLYAHWKSAFETRKTNGASWAQWRNAFDFDNATKMPVLAKDGWGKLFKEDNAGTGSLTKYVEERHKDAILRKADKATKVAAAVKAN